MAIKFTVDEDAGLVHRVMTGLVTEDEFAAYVRDLSEHRGFSPCFNEISDLRGLQGIHIDYASMRAIVSACPFGAQSIRAFVAEHDLGYGTAQMFRGMAAGDHGVIEVFRHFDEAEQWLLHQDVIIPDSL